MTASPIRCASPFTMTRSQAVRGSVTEEITFGFIYKERKEWKNENTKEKKKGERKSGERKGEEGTKYKIQREGERRHRKRERGEKTFLFMRRKELFQHQ